MDHKGDSPFKCPVCKKGFSSKSGMYGHRQTHSKNSLSKCDVCGKEFTVSLVSACSLPYNSNSIENVLCGVWEFYCIAEKG